MTSINLLPWRQEQLERRRKYFLGFLFSIAVVALAAVWLADRAISRAIDRQVARNNLLRQEVSVLDSRIKAIEGLHEQRQQLMARMKVVQGLQADRSTGGRLFDQLARTVPAGVQLRGVTVSGATVGISAMAASNHDVVQLMRSLQASSAMKSPSLQHVRAEKDGSGNIFQLTVQHVSSAREEVRQ